MSFHTMRNVSPEELDLVMYNEGSGSYYRLALPAGGSVLETNTAIAFMPQMDWLLTNELITITPPLVSEDADAVSFWVFGIRGKVEYFSELPDPANEFLYEIYIVLNDEGLTPAAWYRVESVGGIKQWISFYTPGAAEVLVDDVTIKKYPSGHIYVASYPGSLDGGSF